MVYGLHWTKNSSFQNETKRWSSSIFDFLFWLAVGMHLCVSDHVSFSYTCFQSCNCNEFGATQKVNEEQFNGPKTNGASHRIFASGDPFRTRSTEFFVVCFVFLFSISMNAGGRAHTHITHKVNRRSRGHNNQMIIRKAQSKHNDLWKSHCTWRELIYRRNENWIELIEPNWHSQRIP